MVIGFGSTEGYEILYRLLINSIVELAVGLNDRDSAIATAPLKFMHQTQKDSVASGGLHYRFCTGASHFCKNTIETG